MSEIEIVIADPAEPDDISYIAGKVREFNTQVAGHGAPQRFGIYVQGDDGRIAAGAIGELWGRSVHVAAMWVDESQRGRRVGQRLLHELEQYAVERGHTLAYVETLSYQARPFYEKAGYRVFGELEGIDEGCTYYFLRKDLEPSSSAD